MFNQYFSLPFWQTVFLNNTLQNYSLAIILFILLLIIFKIFKVIVLYKLKKLSNKTKTDIDDILLDVFMGIKYRFYFFFSIYLSTKFLTINITISQIINTILILIITYIIINSIQIIIQGIASRNIDKKDKQSKAMIRLFTVIIKAILWSLSILMILSNIGINVTSLVAGLGIGGIAIALALQNILGDLFSSFALYLDKPFKIGDFVIIGTEQGTIEKIGIKTTRIRATEGQQIVISNKELTSVRINNYRRMEERRIKFILGLEYNTSLEKTKKAIAIVEKAIKDTKNAKLDRAHFKEFGESALLCEIVYYVNAPEYAVYMDIQQTINFKIKEDFEKEKISMAFPTQTIHLAK